MYFVNYIVFCFLVLTTKICSRPILFANVRVNKLYSIVIYGNDIYPVQLPLFNKSRHSTTQHLYIRWSKQQQSVRHRQCIPL